MKRDKEDYQKLRYIKLIKKQFKDKKLKILFFLLSKFNNFFFLKKNLKWFSKNKIIIKVAFFTNSKIKIKGSNNEIIISYGVKIKNTTLHISANNCRIFIDEFTAISDSEIYLEDNDCKLLIGKNSTIYSGHFGISEPNSSVILGDNCLISKDVEIRTGDSHSIFDQNNKRRINFAKDVVIHDNVWIAAHVRILKGVVIQRNTVIGNSSVITKPFYKENVVIAGFPAKIIKENIYWDIKRYYHEINN